MRFTPEQEALLKELEAAKTFEEIVAIVNRLPPRQQVSIWAVVVAETMEGGGKEDA